MKFLPKITFGSLISNTIKPACKKPSSSIKAFLLSLRSVVFTAFGAALYSITGALPCAFFAEETADFSAVSIAALEGGASVSENLRAEKARIWRWMVSSNSISAVSEWVKSISHFTPNSLNIIAESFFSIWAHLTKSTAPSPTFK